MYTIRTHQFALLLFSMQLKLLVGQENILKVLIQFFFKKKLIQFGMYVNEMEPLKISRYPVQKKRFKSRFIWCLDYCGKSCMPLVVASGSR